MTHRKNDEGFFLECVNSMESTTSTISIRRIKVALYPNYIAYFSSVFLVVTAGQIF
jgi:hypothetical protein